MFTGIEQTLRSRVNVFGDKYTLKYKGSEVIREGKEGGKGKAF